eukprot:PhF_6_TR4251/c0_g1_i1/m.5750/K20028/ZDHHC2_15_20; palmitoyltransferase ZDHHC2/15/20
MRNFHTHSCAQYPFRLFFSYLPVVFVYFLITWPYYTLTSTFTLPLMATPGQKSMGIFVFCSTTVTIALLLVSFSRCVFTSPGYTSPSWAVAPSYDPRGDGSESHTVSILSRTGEMRFCNVCNLFKADRTHHCRHCERCVLRMDHHCPWINNCVGERNHKYFLQFLLYIPVNGLLIVGFPLSINPKIWELGEGSRPVGTLLNFYFAIIFAAVAGVVLFIFFAINIVMVLQDETAISRAGQRQSASSGCCGFGSWSESVSHIKYICGDSWWRWILPVSQGSRPRRRSSDESLNYSYRV